MPGIRDAVASSGIRQGFVNVTSQHTTTAIAINAAGDARSGYTGLVKGIQDAIRAEVERCMVNWGSAGQADAVLAAADAWQPVHHVIIYNVNADDDRQVDHMMREGKRILGQIPGVRRVVTANAVQEAAQFRFCWLIEFVHENVIDSYRDHPDHLAFANKLFRPVAGDRISIDFAQNA